MKHLRVDGLLVAVQVLHEGTDSAFIFKDIPLVATLVGELDADPGVQERQLAQPLGENFVVELDVREGLVAGLETYGRAGAVGYANLGQRRLRLAHPVFLLVQDAVAVNRQQQRFGQGVDDGHTNAVQAAGYLVGIVIELTAGVQHGHDDLRRGAPFFRVQVHRDAAAVVGNGDGFIGMNGDGNDLAVAGQGLVDGIVDDLENHVVQTGAIVGIADVHSRAFTYRIEAL